MRQLIAEGQIPLPQSAPLDVQELVSWPIGVTAPVDHLDASPTSQSTPRTTASDETFVSAVEEISAQPEPQTENMAKSKSGSAHCDLMSNNVRNSDHHYDYEVSDSTSEHSHLQYASVPSLRSDLSANSTPAEENFTVLANPSLPDKESRSKKQSFSSYNWEEFSLHDINTDPFNALFSPILSIEPIEFSEARTSLAQTGTVLPKDCLSRPEEFRPECIHAREAEAYTTRYKSATISNAPAGCTPDMIETGSNKIFRPVDLLNFHSNMDILPAIDEEYPALIPSAAAPSEQSTENAGADQAGIYSSRISSFSSASSVSEQSPNYTFPVKHGVSVIPSRFDYIRPHRAESYVNEFQPVPGYMPQHATIHQFIRRYPSNPSVPASSEAPPTTKYTSSTSCFQYYNKPRGQLISDLLSQPFAFSFIVANPLTNCRLPSCKLPTSSRSSNTVTCPRCGSLSFVRYCSLKHLQADIRRHYTEECGRRQNHLPYIDMRTVDPASLPHRSFVAVSDPLNDSLERHRQAIFYFYSPNQEVEYHIFNDADLIIVDQAEDFIPTPAMLSLYRGLGSAITSVNFSGHDTTKEQSRATLENLLSLGTSAGSVSPSACRSLYTCVKEVLEERGLWNNIMIERVCLAMQLEFGWRVDSELW